MRQRRLASALAATAAASLWLFAGCSASPAAPPAPGASLYERLGGEAAIAAMLDDALRRIAADPRINRRFAGASPEHLKRNLVDLVCERAGGPCVYKGRNMADAHDGMQISDDEFDAMVDDIAQALDHFGVPARERRESLAILGQMRGAIVGH